MNNLKLLVTALEISLLSPLWKNKTLLEMMKAIKAVSKKIADVQAIVTLNIVYFVVFSLFAFILRLKNHVSQSRDESDKGKNKWSGWSLPADILEDLRRQF